MYRIAKCQKSYNKIKWHLHGESINNVYLLWFIKDIVIFIINHRTNNIKTHHTYKKSFWINQDHRWPQLNIRINFDELYKWHGFCWFIQFHQWRSKMKLFVVRINFLFVDLSYRKKPQDHDKVTGKFPGELKI